MAGASSLMKLPFLFKTIHLSSTFLLGSFYSKFRLPSSLNIRYVKTAHLNASGISYYLTYSPHPLDQRPPHFAIINYTNASNTFFHGLTQGKLLDRGNGIGNRSARAWDYVWYCHRWRSKGGTLLVPGYKFYAVAEFAGACIGYHNPDIIAEDVDGEVNGEGLSEEGVEASG